ncbi:MAG: hypothetical protein ACLFWG_09505, partial [Longimicrobiales bacterium]
MSPEPWALSERQEQEEEGEGESAGDGGWKGALGLFLVAVGASVVNPLVLMAVPFVLLVAVLPAKRTGLVAAGFVAALFAVGAGPTEGMWYLERGWAVLVGG